MKDKFKNAGSIAGIKNFLRTARIDMNVLTAQDLEDLEKCIEGLRNDSVRVEPAGRSCLRFYFRHGFKDLAQLKQRYALIFSDTLGKKAKDKQYAVILDADAGIKQWHFTLHSSTLIELKNEDDPEMQQSAAALMKVLDDMYYQYQMKY